MRYGKLSRRNRNGNSVHFEFYVTMMRGPFKLSTLSNASILTTIDIHEDIKHSEIRKHPGHGTNDQARSFGSLFRIADAAK